MESESDILDGRKKRKTGKEFREEEMKRWESMKTTGVASHILMSSLLAREPWDWSHSQVCVCVSSLHLWWSSSCSSIMTAPLRLQRRSTTRSGRHRTHTLLTSGIQLPCVCVYVCQSVFICFPCKSTCFSTYVNWKRQSNCLSHV